MVQYILTRLMESILVLFIISILAFCMIHLTPGDPAMALYGEQFLKMRVEDRQHIRENLGLDQPLPLQYFRWIKAMVRGDMGRSYVHGENVLDLILKRLPATLLLTMAAAFLIMVITLVLGVYSGLRRYSFLDYFSTIVSFIFMSIPGFWLGLMLILVFCVILQWLPSAGMRSLGSQNGALDIARHLILPSIVLSLTHIGYYIRLLRGGVATVKDQNFVLVLKARGIRDLAIVYKHILRNALIPVITYLGVSVSVMLAGSVVTEAIFAWPGIGLLSVEAALRKDYPVLMGTVLLSGAMVVSGSLLADLFCAWLDPRIVMHRKP